MACAQPCRVRESRPVLRACRLGAAGALADVLHRRGEPSSVTQTILGLPYNNNPKLVAEPDHLTISATDTARSGHASKFLPPPVAIPPHGVRIIRLTHDTGSCKTSGPGRAEFWTDLDLKVRVGAFTRIETVDFADHVFELRGTPNIC